MYQQLLRNYNICTHAYYKYFDQQNSFFLFRPVFYTKETTHYNLKFDKEAKTIIVVDT